MEIDQIMLEEKVDSEKRADDFFRLVILRISGFNRIYFEEHIRRIDDDHAAVELHGFIDYETVDGENDQKQFLSLHERFPVEEYFRFKDEGKMPQVVSNLKQRIRSELRRRFREMNNGLLDLTDVT